MAFPDADFPDDAPSSEDVSRSDKPQAPPPPDNDCFPVVGIGASAGGLEAFTHLLEHLPADTGMGFVFVQHLDPNRPSLLDEILARITKMPVHVVEDEMAIAPNHVYVIPYNTTMTLEANHLRLLPRDQGQHMPMAIDIFFHSLAESRGSKAIAVVLSGGNDDGTLGLEAIKAAGGITFAQITESAEVDSMPKSAIASGQVDFTLTPEAIATELVNISQHPFLATPNPEVIEHSFANKQDSLSSIFGLLRSAFGLDFTHYKNTTIQRRIGRRMALHHLETLDDYLRYIEENPAEVRALYQEILIHVTSFFRDPEAFANLKRDVFPALLRDRPPNMPIRVWVAGCATGEEAYSIAISLLEFLAHQPQPPQIQIFATDVSERSIEKARLGVYSPSQVSNVSPECLQNFFVASNGSYQIKKTLRECCVFARQNLIGDPPFSRMDLISCRNVLIYLGASLQKKILPIFHYGLKPNGFLMLGSSETVGDFSSLFHLIDQKNKIYLKQASSLSLRTDLNIFSPPAETPPSPLEREGHLDEGNLFTIADQIVLSAFAPVGVLVNANLDIVQFRGQTGAYLEPSPGQASLNVLRLIKEELRLDLRTLLHQVKKDRKVAYKEGIKLKDREHTWQVKIDVIPIQVNATDDDHFLILFGETLLPTEPKTRAKTRTSASQKKQSQEQSEVLRLEKELDITKLHLKSIIEEQQSSNQDLRAANEEILSSNEELQSTNEELQTAKEEIQATNEELSTINDELYRRNAETVQVNNDFQNLLSSINIPILMLEADLRIRRFTPTAATLFNLIPSDIGRPFGDIKHKLKVSDLDEQILEVIDTLNIKTQEVQDQNGCWFDLRIRPYRTLDNRIDGAVIVLFGIDALKRSSERLREAEDYANAIVQTLREPLIVLNADLHVVTANQRFYDTFKVSPQETEKNLIFDLGNQQWNIPQLRSLLEDILPHNTEINDFQVEHKFEQIGQKVMLLNARRMPLNNGDALILLAIEDGDTFS